MTSIRGKTFCCALINYSVAQPGLHRVPLMHGIGYQQGWIPHVLGARFGVQYSLGFHISGMGS